MHICSNPKILDSCKALQAENEVFCFPEYRRLGQSEALPGMNFSHDGVDGALAHLLTTYNELNSSVIDELSEEPSPLEFMRFVSRNTPFVVRGGAASWKAVREWDFSYLTTTLDKKDVKVAVTPHG